MNVSVYQEFRDAISLLQVGDPPLRWDIPATTNFHNMKNLALRQSYISDIKVKTWQVGRKIWVVRFE